jgi:hypothetical protein
MLYNENIGIREKDKDGYKKPAKSHKERSSRFNI